MAGVELRHSPFGASRPGLRARSPPPAFARASRLEVGHDLVGLTPKVRAPEYLYVRQRIAVVLTAWLVVAGIATASTCEGWQPTPSARRACCAASQHHCGSQMAADACCGQSEQSQQPRVQCVVVGIAAPSPALVPFVTSLDLEWSPRHAAAAIFERTIQQRPHSPPTFLTSVLLI